MKSIIIIFTIMSLLFLCGCGINGRLMLLENPPFETTHVYLYGIEAYVVTLKQNIDGDPSRAELWIDEQGIPICGALFIEQLRRMLRDVDNALDIIILQPAPMPPYSPWEWPQPERPEWEIIPPYYNDPMPPYLPDDDGFKFFFDGTDSLNIIHPLDFIQAVPPCLLLEDGGTIIFENEDGEQLELDPWGVLK